MIMFNASGPSSFSIEHTGFLKRKRRLVANSKLTPADFAAISAALGRTPIKARKTALIAARRAQALREVVTEWKGEVTRNTAKPGDWIATSLNPDRSVMRDSAGKENSYVIAADRFDALYERVPGECEFGAMFRGKPVVEALHLSGGLDITAPWGERQTMTDGYLLKNGEEVYGNERWTFETAYQPLS